MPPPPLRGGRQHKSIFQSFLILRLKVLKNPYAKSVSKAVLLMLQACVFFCSLLHKPDQVLKKGQGGEGILLKSDEFDTGSLSVLVKRFTTKIFSQDKGQHQVLLPYGYPLKSQFLYGHLKAT